MKYRAVPAQLAVVLLDLSIKHHHTLTEQVWMLPNQIVLTLWSLRLSSLDMCPKKTNLSVKYEVGPSLALWPHADHVQTALSWHDYLADTCNEHPRNMLSDFKIKLTGELHLPMGSHSSSRQQSTNKHSSKVSDCLGNFFTHHVCNSVNCVVLICCITPYTRKLTIIQTA